jgi:hypothetical protein
VLRSAQLMTWTRPSRQPRQPSGRFPVGVDQRLGLLGRIVDEYKPGGLTIGMAISAEMGAPAAFARNHQADSGLGHLRPPCTR